MRNEKTSKQVARVAGQVLSLKYPKSATLIACFHKQSTPWAVNLPITWGDIMALAASCLTQAPDKPKRKRK